jgi:hypothetical protein
LPTQPPRDASGAVTPHDHDEITGDDIIIRRISPQQIVFNSDNVRRISSIAYRPSSGPNGGMSIDVHSFIVADEVDPKAWVMTPPWIGSVSFTASFLRAQEFMVGYDPLEEPLNPYHGEVWGNFSKGKQNALRNNAVWFVAIPDVELY